MKKGRHWVIAACAALPLGVMTTLSLAWAIAEWRPLPDEIPMRGGLFMHWDDPWPWHTVERRAFGVTVVGWSRATADYVTAPAQGVAGRIADQFRMAMMTPDEVMERLQESRERLKQERPAFVSNDQPPHWGTFARHEPPATGQRCGSDAAFGWPMRCLWFQVDAQYGQNRVWGDQLHGGILRRGQPSAVIRQFRALPLMPIWPGMIGNTLFYAGLWFLALLISGTIRQTVRKRRGCCVQCGYDLSGNTVAGCPECGLGRT